MRSCLLFVFVPLLIASPVFSQGYIGLYSDPGLNDPNLMDTVGLITVYVAHDQAENFIASRWKLELDPRLALIYLGNTYNYPGVSGDLFSGVVINYGSCVNGTTLLATINYFGNGMTPACSWIDVVADPATTTGSVEVIDCDGYKWLVNCNNNAIEMRVNPDGTCWGGPG